MVTDIRHDKLAMLKSMGWSKKDFMTLCEEIADILFCEDNTQKVSRDREVLVTELLKEWGFSFSNEGSSYLRDILLYCIEKQTSNILLKKKLYLVIQEKYDIEYEQVRTRIRTAIYNAFDNPTTSAKKVFRVSIKKRGYPTIKEFITESYDQINLILQPMAEAK